MLIFLVALVVATVAVAVVAAWLFQVWPWRALQRRRVIVVTKQDKTISGVLWQRRGPLLVVRQPVVLDQGRQTSADGEMVIERDQVQWMQVLS